MLCAWGVILAVKCKHTKIAYRNHNSGDQYLYESRVCIAFLGKRLREAFFFF